METYKSVGGWLLLFCLGLTVFSPLLTIFNFVSNYELTSSLFDQYPGLQTIFYVDGILSIILMTLSIRAGIALWRITPGAVVTAKNYLLILLVYSIIAIFLPFMAGLPSEANDAMIPDVALGAFKSIIYFGIWYSYLNVSIRVKETYVFNSVSEESVTLASDLGTTEVNYGKALLHFQTEEETEVLMECPPFTGQAYCSDDDCPCSNTSMPPAKGYLWINAEVEKTRSNYLSMSSLLSKLEESGISIVDFQELRRNYLPIVVCEVAARRRNLDMNIANSDYNSWVKTAMVPCRKTPVALGEALPAILNSSRPSIEWVTIPGGTFIMGSPGDEAERDIDEIPHQVTLSDFLMSKYEITFEQFDLFCEATNRKKPDDEGWGRSSRPVINVNWHDSDSFADWMGCRLPTESEWEYACRAGTTTPFYTGINLLTIQSNYNGNFPYNGNDKGEFRNRTIPTGSFSPNAWGLYDMHGNVWEWCCDWYGNYPTVPLTNTGGAASGQECVVRGGSWNNDARYCRSAIRSSNIQNFSSDSIGFRLVSYR